MSIGLCGGHRTGKTTLAQAIALAINQPFVKTDTSGVFKEFGLDPAQPMDFETRLRIQDQILVAAAMIWTKAAQQSYQFVSDRTPIDMMAYTLGDIQGITPVNFAALEHYIDRCFALTNQFFTTLAIVQPGIPLVYEEGKAALNQAYIEHINILVMGLCGDRRLQASVLCLDRHMTDLSDRVQIVVAHVNSNAN